MGGAYRSDESLTLAFPPFIWKLIVGEHVTWAKDYVAIDEAAVHITGESNTDMLALYPVARLFALQFAQFFFV